MSVVKVNNPEGRTLVSRPAQDWRVLAAGHGLLIGAVVMAAGG